MPALAFPVPQQPPPAPAGQIDCNNITANFHSSCWNTLNIPDYLGNHEHGWIYKTPTCDSSTDDGVNNVGCCAPDEPWSTCFMRIGRGLPGAQCVTISPGDCDWDEEQLNSSMTEWERARARYVIWNIVSMNHFFDSYWHGLQFAISSATLMVESLTQMLDPVKKPSVNLLTILSVLAVAFCFLGLPAVLEGVAAAATMVTAKVLTKSLQKTAVNSAQGFTLAVAGTPGFTRAVWPQGNSASQDTQVAALNDQLREANQQIGNTLNNGLGVLMTDPWSFNTFGANGSYSDTKPLSIPQDAQNLDLALETYLTGTSLMQNDWFANVNPQTDQAAIKDFTKECSEQIPNTGIYSCHEEAHYWSKQSGRWYALRHKKKKGSTGENSVNVLLKIAQNAWADLITLFDGAYDCTASGKAGGNPVSTNPDGTLDMSCISVLPIFVDYDYGCPAALMPDGKCPFWHQI